jgi:hypothetical protein
MVPATWSPEPAERLGLGREVVRSTRLLLFGSVAQVVEKLHAIREAVGISHVVVRDAKGFAPVVDALAER